MNETRKTEEILDNVERLIGAKMNQLADLQAKNAKLHKALASIQWGFNHSRCPACAGMGPNGETDFMHTPDCPVADALSL